MIENTIFRKEDRCMKRMLSVAISFILFSILTGCNADDEEIVILEDLNNPSREEIRAKTQDQPETATLLSKEVGIGAVRKQFDQAYGRNDGDFEIARYQGEFMIVTFETHRAVNVQYQFAYKPGESMSEEEMDSYIRERIPMDAVEIKRTNADTDQEVIQYFSASLRNKVSAQSFRGDEPGNFVVLFNKNEQGEISVTVSLGGKGKR
jgi:hypothetical protein